MGLYRNLIPVPLIFVATVCALAAQSPTSAQVTASPQFRSGVVVLRLDASVVDDQGRALSDLTPEEFQVTLDGRPRKVVYAQFTGGPVSAASAANANSTAIASYAVNAQRSGGRAIVFVVDLESIRAGSEQRLLDTAAQVVERLRPIDAAAVVPLPGRSIDLTRDHRRVTEAIRGLRGMSQISSYDYSFSFEEALAFERRDSRVIAEVIERECRPEKRRAQAGLPQTCPPQLQRDTADRLIRERLHIQTVLTDVVRIANQLRTVKAPATIVLLSGGLGFDQQSLARFQEVQRALKDTGVSIATVHLNQPLAGASIARGLGTAYFSSGELQTGLANVATMSGGAFYSAIGSGAGVFERLRTELTEAYEIGIEAEPGDLDGKPHEVRVTTTRNAKVRARQFLASPAPTSDWPARLSNLLTQPVDVADLPIAVAAHSLRGDEPTTLKVMIRADIGRGMATTAPIRYAAIILGEQDAVAMNVTGTAAADGGVLISTQLAPGAYRLRMAAIDGTGREATFEVPIVAGIRNVAGLQLSDVIVGTRPDGSLMPSIYAPTGPALVPALELSTADAERFTQTQVTFEMRRSGSETVIAAAEAQLQPTAYERQRIARASLPTDKLDPGEYTLSAIVKVDGQPAGRVSRMLVVERGKEVVVATTEPSAVPAPAAPGTAADAAPPAIADPMLADVMRKVAAYVATYGEEMSAVVGVEKYTQNVNPAAGQPLRPRQLIAEFALVKSGGAVPWSGYRDVIEVNGEPVHDRRDRLLKILGESSNPVEEAARLTAESARFNIGPVSRNFNLPTTVLFFFHESNLPRFKFTSRGTKRIDGVEVLEIAFVETGRPTLIATRAGIDVPGQGTLWVVPTDGTIVRTRLALKGFADSIRMGDSRPEAIRVPPPAPPPAGVSTSPPPAPSAGGTQTGTSGGGQTGGTTARPAPAGSSERYGQPSRFAGIPDFGITKLESTAEIEVTYRRDAKLGMWLPARMTEEYQGAIPRINNAPILGLARSNATYSDYKRFGTSATIVGVKQ